MDSDFAAGAESDEPGVLGDCANAAPATATLSALDKSNLLSI
jgi:hypothetical protein